MRGSSSFIMMIGSDRMENVVLLHLTQCAIDSTNLDEKMLQKFHFKAKNPTVNSINFFFPFFNGSFACFECFHHRQCYNVVIRLLAFFLHFLNSLFNQFSPQGSSQRVY